MANIFSEGLSTFLGLTSAIIIWWIKVEFERRGQRTSLLVAIGAELMVARKMVLKTLKEVLTAMENNVQSYKKSFHFEPKVYPEMVKNIGVIGDKSTINYIIKTYGILESFGSPLPPDDKYGLPLFAHKLELAYNAIDGLEALFKKQYSIDTSLYGLIESAQDFLEYVDLPERLLEIIFEKYLDLAKKIYPSDEKASG